MSRPHPFRFAGVALVVALLGCDTSGSGGGGGASSDGSGTAGGGEAGGGDTGPACFGHAPTGSSTDGFSCGGVGLSCAAGQACVRLHHPLETSADQAACPEPAGCPTPPDDVCWLYECHDLPPDCGRDCSCIEPHLQYASHPAATCSDDDGHVWIDGSPVLEQPPWRDPCFGACGGDERCWLCGPSGGCMPDSEDPACQSTTRCSVDDPSGYPHPTCVEQPLL